MKFSKQALTKLKKKDRKLKPHIYGQLKRELTRGRVKGTLERPRLSIYRSNENMYAQLIDDVTGNTLISCTTRQREIKLRIKNGRTCDSAKILGEHIAKRSLEKNIEKVIFDRGPYLYHGRIKAIADGARIGGLKF